MTQHLTRGLLVAAMLLMGLQAEAQEQAPFVRGSFAAIRASYAGKPLIVHFWSMACAPCLTEMPVWGRIAAANHTVGLVLVEADRPDGNPDPRGRQRLKSAGLDAIESWTFADRYEDRLRFEIDPDWQGELPRTLLITASGAITTIAGPVEAAQVERWIAEQSK